MERKDEVVLKEGPDCPTCGNKVWSVEGDKWFCTECGQMRIYNEELRRDKN